jgi:hypothetical protein
VAVAHHAVVVAHHRARVAAVTVTGMTVTVQAVMAGVMIGVMIVRRVVVDAPSGVMIGRQVVVDAPSGVMIGRQAVVVAQQANPPMMIAVKRGQPVAAVLKVAVARTVIVLQNVMIAQTVEVALKGAMIKPAPPAVASHHSVISQLVAAKHHSVISQLVAVSRHLAASPPLTNVQILVISQRRKSHHPIEAMVAQNAHHLPRKSALARRGQAVMPHRRAARAR